MWATDKQVKFIRSLILRNGTINDLDGKYLVLEDKTTLRINSNNEALILGGVKFEKASLIIGCLLNKKFEIKG